MSSSGSKKLFRPPTLIRHTPNLNTIKSDGDDNFSKDSTPLSKNQINAKENHNHLNLKKQSKHVKQKSLPNSQYGSSFDSVITQNETSNKTTELHSKQNSSQTIEEKQKKLLKSTFLFSSQYNESSSKISENENSNETTEFNVEQNSSQKNEEKQTKCAKSYFQSNSKYDELFSSEINQNETSNENTKLNTEQNSSETNQKKQRKYVKQKSLSNSQYDRLFTSVIYGNQINCEDSEADVPEEHDAAIPLESAEHSKNISLTSKNQTTKEKNHKKYAGTSLQESSSVKVLKPDSKQFKKRWLTPAQKSDIKKSFSINENVSRNSGKRSGTVPDTRDMFKSPKKIRLTKPNSICNSQSASSKFDSITTSSRQSRGFPASQPPDNLNHRERLEWLQERRNVGVWVQCDRSTCKKWRYLCDTKDPIDVPKEWHCSLNPDKEMATCSAPEKGPTVIEEDDLVHNLYTAGSVVWAHLDGYPWWPAMVDDCPDTEQYYWLNELSDIPTHYNVTFFDSNDVTRAWMSPSDLKPYNADDSVSKFATRRGKYAARIKVAEKQALECKKLDMADRLKKYSFLSRWKGPINTPKDCIKSRAKSNRKTKMNNEKKSNTDIESLLEKSLTNILEFDDESGAIKQKTSQTSLNISKKSSLGKEQLRKLSQKEVCEKIQAQSQNVQEEILGRDEESKSANNENNLNESLTQFLEESVNDLVQNSPILNSLQDAIFSTETLDNDDNVSDCDLFEQNTTQSN